MNEATIWYGLAVAFVVALSIAMRRSHDALPMVAILATGFAISAALDWRMPYAEAARFNPHMDLAAAALAAVWIRRTRRHWWKIAMVASFAAQCALHVSQIGADPTDDAATMRYAVTVCVVFSAQLALTAWFVGGGELVSDCVHRLTVPRHRPAAGRLGRLLGQKARPRLDHGG